MVSAPTLRTDLVEAAHVLSRLGLVTAYGHVSAHAGGSMLITPAADLATVTESTLVDVPLEASSLPTTAPAEAWAHLALYRARPEVASIARAQPASAFAAAATTTALAPLHGQTAWLGERIPVADSAHLLRSAALAEAAARSLPSGEALLLRGNGALTVGATPGVAARRWRRAAATALSAPPAAGLMVRLETPDRRPPPTPSSTRSSQSVSPPRQRLGAIATVALLALLPACTRSGASGQTARARPAAAAPASTKHPSPAPPSTAQPARFHATISPLPTALAATMRGTTWQRRDGDRKSTRL